MSGADDARALLEAVGGYVETPPGAAPPSQDRPVRLATVAAGYSGTGPVPVIFDGEALAGLRQYVPLAPVASGQRVALLPVGATYVVLGRVDGPTIGSTAGPGFLEVATDAETFAFTRADAAVSPASLGKVLRPFIGQIPSSAVVGGSGTATVLADGTVTFSVNGNVVFNDVFNGIGGDIYEVHWLATMTTASYLQIQFTSGGVVYAGAGYVRDLAYAGPGSAFTSLTDTQAALIVGSSASGSAQNGRLTITDPARNAPTTYFGQYNAAAASKNIVTGYMTVPNVFDGFRLSNNSGSSGLMVGKIKVVKVS